MSTRTLHDRTVHAENDCFEIVRYDRTGKYYIEWRDGRRRRITIKQAVGFTYSGACTVHQGRPGGRTFDRMWLSFPTWAKALTSDDTPGDDA